jgi:cytochrome P450 family 307 subfamily A
MQKTISLDKEFHLKPLIMQTCANIFFSYMCSIKFDCDDEDFKQLVKNYDELTWEVHKSYAVDFLPFLRPFYSIHMKKLESWSGFIREFIMRRVINVREQKLNAQEEVEDDFTDALLRSLRYEKDLSKETILFMLEDFLGGHAVIGEFFQ